MTDVSVNLVAESNIAAVANKAAAAMTNVAKQEERVQDVAKQLGTTDIKAVGKALDEVAKQEQKAATKAAQLEKKNFTKETRYARQKLGFLSKERETQDKLLEALGPETAGAMAEVAAGAAAAGAAILIGVAAATALGIAIASAAEAAGNARNSAQSMIGVLTNGQGAKGLELVDGLAGQLGVKFGDARDSFIKFRQAGLDNKQSAALIKLKADLDAIDPSGALAAQAVGKVTDLKGGKGTSELMAKLAKQAGVVGDGALAASQKFSTLGGAIASLDNTKTSALQQIFDKINPAIGAAAGKVAQFADSFLKSERGQKLINQIGDAIAYVANLAADMLPTVVSGLEGIIDAGEAVVGVVQSVIGWFQQSAVAGEALSGVWEGLKIVGYAAAAAVAVLVAGSLLLVAPFYAAGAALVYLTGKIAEGIAWIVQLPTKMGEAGAAVVDGFIGGIQSKIANVQKVVSGLAGSVSSAFSNALGIHSPSKVFHEHGKDSAEGYTGGWDKHAPDGGEMSDSVTPGAPSGASAPVSSPAGVAVGGSGGLSVTIENLNVPMGADPDAHARALRRELMLMLQIIQLNRGAIPGVV